MAEDIEQRLIQAVLWFAGAEGETVDEVMKGVLPLRYSGIWLFRAPDGDWSAVLWPDRMMPGLESWILMTEAKMRGESWDHFTFPWRRDGRSARLGRAGLKPLTDQLKRACPVVPTFPSDMTPERCLVGGAEVASPKLGGGLQRSQFGQNGAVCARGVG